MGLLDSVIAGLVGGGQSGGGGQQSQLLQAAVGMLANGGQGGGLGDLMARFQQHGLGDVIGSWIGTGANLPISPDQLSRVLGPDTLGQIASQLGVSHGEAAGHLSQLLPHVLDKLTPQGSVPTGGLGDAQSLLGRLLRS
jgi:uncharacterized protein YidB (DUF937 family)